MSKMRSTVLVGAVALAILCHLAAGLNAQGTTLFKEGQAIATVHQQRSLLQAASTPPPTYSCPNSRYPSSRTVKVYVAVTPKTVVRLRPRRVVVVSRATFGYGRLVLHSAINKVYQKFKRPRIKLSQIKGPRKQTASRTTKRFVYTFKLPLGKCGTNKRALDKALKAAIKNLKGARVKWVKLSQYK